MHVENEKGENNRQIISLLNSCLEIMNKERIKKFELLLAIEYLEDAIKEIEKKF